MTLASVAPSVAATVQRQDGIIANSPRDGFITPEELSQSLQSPAVDLLSATEQADLRAATSLLSWEAAPAKAFPQLPKFEIPQRPTQVDPQRWPAPTPDLGFQFRVTPYPATIDNVFATPWIRQVAERIQRVANPDGNPQTISVNDVRSARATHGSAFTEQERGYMNELEAGLLTMAQKQARTAGPATPNVGSRLDITRPQGAKLPLTSNGPAALSVLSTVSEELTRSSAKFTRRNEFVLEVPPGHQVVLAPADLQDRRTVMNGGRGYIITDEKVFEAGTHDRLALPPGEYLLETFRNGQRVQQENVHLERLPGASIGGQFGVDGTITNDFNTETIEAQVPGSTVFTVDGKRLDLGTPNRAPGIFEAHIKEFDSGQVGVDPTSAGQLLQVTTRGEGPASVSLGGAQATFHQDKTGQWVAQLPMTLRFGAKADVLLKLVKGNKVEFSFKNDPKRHGSFDLTQVGG